MTSSWPGVSRIFLARQNAHALRQLSATLQQWTETLSARIESVDATAAQHRATQSQLIANLRSSVDNLPEPAPTPIVLPATAPIDNLDPSDELATKADVEQLRASFESWHTTTWTRITNLTARVDAMEQRQATSSGVAQHEMTELRAQIQQLAGSLDGQPQQ